jgi:microsomal dipeptidase-like Zn-dependent dipeptidase
VDNSNGVLPSDMDQYAEGVTTMSTSILCRDFFAGAAKGALSLVGVDHAAMGTDTCCQADWPEGASSYPNTRFSTRWWGNWNERNHPLSGKSDEAARGSLACTSWPPFAVGLVMRGYRDDEIAKILSGNFLRVLEANQPLRQVRA